MVRFFSLCALATTGVLVGGHPTGAFAPNVSAREALGVLVGGGGRVPVNAVTNILKDLDARWLRLNDHLDGRGPDAAAYLKAGMNLVITFNNTDRTNIDTRLGTLREFPNAGFPFRSKVRYQERIRAALQPLVSSLRQGQQVLVQCENEVSDASRNPRSRYWRGTTQQYLEQLAAFAEAVRSLHGAVPVVLTSFASGTLDAVIQPSDPRHREATAMVDALLAAQSYDAVDLHFYGCVEQIDQKVAWIKKRMRPGARWISTENGGPDSRCPSTPITWERDATRFERLQAQQVDERLTACVEQGGDVCLWFSLFDLSGESSVFSHLGLIGFTSPGGRAPRGREGGGLRKKPAYQAFKSFTGRP